MVAYADVVAARAVAVEEAASAWAELAGTLGAAAESVVAEVARPLESSWDGDAANAAFALVDTYDDELELELAALRARGLSGVFTAAAERIAAVQRAPAEVVDTAVAAGLSVSDEGRVALPWADLWDLHDPDGMALRAQLAEQARNVQHRLDTLVAEATAVDEEFAGLVSGFDIEVWDRGGNRGGEWARASDASTAMALFAGLSPDAIPAPGGDPAANASWWQGLTPARRQFYADAWPQRVGSLDGLPAVTRDAANRRWLRRHLDDLRNPVLTLPREHQEPVLHVATPERIANREALLDRLEAQDADPNPDTQPLFLLKVDTRGDGRAVVAIGNPDTAQHVAVAVPGTGMDLAGVEGQINRWNNMQVDATQDPALAPGDVAVVVWFDYDAPATLPEATDPQMAKDAGADLTRFVDGVRTAHTGPDPHITVLGHSYGSAVVGEAARLADDTGHPRPAAQVLRADDIVVTGSPGMHVPNADGLNITDGHLWVGMADADWMRAGGDIPGHGPDPHTPDFGTERIQPFHFDVDPGWDRIWPTDADIDPTRPHSSYWDGSDDGLGTGAANQTHIIIGHHDRVTGAPYGPPGTGVEPAPHPATPPGPHTPDHPRLPTPAPLPPPPEPPT